MNVLIWDCTNFLGATESCECRKMGIVLSHNAGLPGDHGKKHLLLLCQKCTEPES